MQQIGRVELLLHKLNTTNYQVIKALRLIC